MFDRTSVRLGLTFGLLVVCGLFAWPLSFRWVPGPSWLSSVMLAVGLTLSGGLVARPDRSGSSSEVRSTIRLGLAVVAIPLMLPLVELADLDELLPLLVPLLLVPLVAAAAVRLLRRWVRWPGRPLQLLRWGLLAVPVALVCNPDLWRPLPLVGLLLALIVLGLGWLRELARSAPADGQVGRPGFAALAWGLSLAGAALLGLLLLDAWYYAGRQTDDFQTS